MTRNVDKWIRAAVEGDAESIDQYLAYGFQVDASNVNGATALQMACANYRSFVAGLLLENGAEVDKPNPDGLTAMHQTVAAPIVDGLVDKQLQCIEALCSRGANLDKKSDAGFTPLMYAAWFGNVSAAGFLVELGANPLITDGSGKTAGAIARDRGHQEIASFLDPEIKLCLPPHSDA